MRPVLAGCLWFPTDKYDAAALRERFTVSYRPLGAKEDTLVEAYVEGDGWIGVPRQAGLKLISLAECDDARSIGHPVAHTRTPTLRPAQVPFVEAMMDAIASMSVVDFMSYAATGKGKTVCSLAVYAQCGVTGIALVDQERLMRQWIERAQEHLGMDPHLTPEEVMAGKGEDIGIVQGPLCNYEGKKLVVAMIQSLTQRRYDELLYDYFGVMMVDECHVAGAPTFSQTLMMFSAAIRFGVSATPDRTDALKKLLVWNLGYVETFLHQKHLPSRLYVCESDAVFSWYANKAKTTGRYLQEVADHPSRNLAIAQAIKFLHSTDRCVLAVSDRTEHLCNLMSLCEGMGIPAEDMGIYARSRIEWRWVQDPTPKRRPYGLEKGAAYTPLRYEAVQVAVPRRELSRVIDTAKVIFATYKMFEKGVDVVRLSAGIDCTPRAKATQVHGRILRTGAGKKVPIWITIRDIFSYRAEYQFLARLQDYVDSNAEVFTWHPDKGIRKEDAWQYRVEVERNQRLVKGRRISTRYDGSYTLLT